MLESIEKNRVGRFRANAWKSQQLFAYCAGLLCSQRNKGAGIFSIQECDERLDSRSFPLHEARGLNQDAQLFFGNIAETVQVENMVRLQIFNRLFDCAP